MYSFSHLLELYCLQPIYMTLYNEITELLFLNIHLEFILFECQYCKWVLEFPTFKLLMMDATSSYFLFGLLTLFDFLSVLFS